MFVALGNSDLDLYYCQDFLPKKGNLGDLGEGNIDMHIILEWMRYLLYLLAGLRKGRNTHVHHTKLNHLYSFSLFFYKPF